LSPASQCERFVRGAADKRNRAPGDHARAARIELAAGIGDQMAKEHREQVLKPVAAAEDARLVKDLACHVALKRLDETGFVT
jgi:hypothetical protein